MKALITKEDKRSSLTYEQEREIEKCLDMAFGAFSSPVVAHVNSGNFYLNNSAQKIGITPEVLADMMTQTKSHAYELVLSDSYYQITKEQMTFQQKVVDVYMFIDFSNLDIEGYSGIESPSLNKRLLAKNLSQQSHSLNDFCASFILSLNGLFQMADIYVEFDDADEITTDIEYKVLRPCLRNLFYCFYAMFKDQKTMTKRIQIALTQTNERVCIKMTIPHLRFSRHSLDKKIEVFDQQYISFSHVLYDLEKSLLGHRVRTSLSNRFNDHSNFVMAISFDKDFKI